MVHDKGSPDTRLLLLREDLGTEGGRALARKAAAPCLWRQGVLPPTLPQACTETVQAAPSLIIQRAGDSPRQEAHRHLFIKTDEAWRPFPKEE
jgi:hypothetical protein